MFVDLIPLTELPCLTSVGEDEPSPAVTLLMCPGGLIPKGSSAFTQEKGREDWVRGGWEEGGCD